MKRIMEKSKSILCSNTVICKNKEIEDVDLDGEKVMMNIKIGKYIMMNDVGTRIWNMIDSEMMINEIVDILMSEYKVNREVCERETINFLKTLYDSELIFIR